MFPNLFHLLRTRKPVRRHPGRKTFQPILHNLEGRWLPSTVNWIGGSGYFDVASNWKDATTGTNHVPTPADDAVIPNADLTVTIRDAEAVNSLSMRGGGPYVEALTITGTGSLTVTNHEATVSDLWQLDLQSGARLTTSGNPTSLERGGAIEGTIAVASDASLAFSNGTFLVQSGARFTGIGTNEAGTIQVAGATVNLNTDVALANLDLNSGTLTGAGDLTVSGVFTWSGQSTMGGSGTTTVLAGGSFTILGNGDKTLANTRTLENDTAGTWSGSGNWNIYGGTFINADSFSVQNDQSINNYLGSAGTIDNLGTWTKTSAVGRTTTVNVPFNNSGSVEVAGGQLYFNYGGTETGPFTADAGATLNFGNGNFLVLDGAQLTGDGLTSITGGTAEIDAAVSATNLDLAAGTLTGSGDLTVSGAFTWSGESTMRGSGTTTVLAGGSFTILGNGDKSLEDTRTLENDTTGATWSGSGNWNIFTGSTFVNAGSFTVQNDRSINNYLGGAGTIDNTGTWTKTSDLGHATTVNVPFNNTGTVEVASGVLSMNYAGTNTGLISIDGGSFTIANSTYALADGTVIVGTSPLTLAGGTAAVTGSITVPSFLQTGGTLAGSGSLVISDPVNGGAFAWTGGTISVASLNIAADATLTINGNGGKTLSGSTLTLDGVANWSGGNIGFGSRAALNVEMDGSFNILSDTINLTGDGTFRNRGLVTKQNLAGTTQVTIAFYNDDPGARVEVASGILQIDNFTQNAGTTDVATGATLASGGNTLTLQGGELTGMGTVMVNQGNGTLVNVAGTISPGGDGTVGTLTIAGSLTNQALGVVNIDIDGTDAGTYDQLIVTGTVTLNGGTVNVTFGPDYSPTDQDSFTVLVSQRGVINGNPGDFEVYNFNGLDPSFQMAHRVGGGSLTLTVQTAASAPGTAGDGAGKQRRDSFGVADEVFVDFAPTW